MNQNLIKKIVVIIEKATGARLSEYDYDRSLQNDFSMDSICLVELIMGIEEEFQFEFEDTDLDISHFKTVTTIYHMLNKHYACYLGDFNE